jgi:DNA gyrase subunit A
VAAIKVAKGDRIISGSIVCGDEKAYSVLLVSEKGWAKRVPLTAFPTQGRGGQGVQTLKITPVTGKVAAASVGQNKSNANIISGQGRRHHLSVSEFPESNRVNRGEQIIDFGADDTVQQLTTF